MRTFLVAAALLAGTSALAQNTMTPPVDPAVAPSTPTGQDAVDAVTPPVSVTPPTAPTPTAPLNTAVPPSSPGMAGSDSTSSRMDPAAGATAQAGTADQSALPRCSRKVTDSCYQKGG